MLVGVDVAGVPKPPKDGVDPGAVAVFVKLKVEPVDGGLVVSSITKEMS